MSGEYEEQVKGEKMEDMEEKEEKLTLEKFEEATEAVSKVISETKLVYSEHFSNMTGNKVYFKPENMQYTGAYKVRGAYYKISTLSEEEKSRGLITASAGNHAQGVAYAAKLAGAGAVIVMPTTTPMGPKWYSMETYLTRPWPMPTGWLPKRVIHLSILLMIWMLPQVRERSRWRLSKSCPR